MFKKTQKGHLNSFVTAGALALATFGSEAKAAADCLPMDRIINRPSELHYAQKFFLGMAAYSILGISSLAALNFRNRDSEKEM